MKKIKCLLLGFVFIFIVTTPILADSYTIGCNSRAYLQYGHANTSCKDTLYDHSYTTNGVANNLNCRIGVYVANSSGQTKASGSSSATSRNAYAIWNNNTSVAHKHAAISGLFTR